MLQESLPYKLALVLDNLYNQTLWCEITVLNFKDNEKIGGTEFIFYDDPNKVSKLMEVLCKTIDRSESQPDPIDVKLILKFWPFNYPTSGLLSKFNYIIYSSPPLLYLARVALGLLAKLFILGLILLFLLY